MGDVMPPSSVAEQKAERGERGESDCDAGKINGVDAAAGEEIVERACQEEHNIEQGDGWDGQCQGR